MKNKLSIRWKLSLGYAAGLFLILALYSVGVLYFLQQRLYSELDHALQEDLQVCEQALEISPEGNLNWDLDEDKKEILGRWFEVHHPGGTLQFTSPNLSIPKSGNLEKLLPELNAPPKTITWRKHSKFRVSSRETTIGNIPVVLRAARSEEGLREGLTNLVVVMLAALPIVLGLALLGGYTLAGRALSPISKIAAQARRIGAENLHERLPVENEKDELGQLAQVFNETLGRLEKSFDSLRRFTADASHELRTPLTTLRTVGEVTLQKDPDIHAYREAIGSMLEEVNRMNHLVEGLLTLSRAEGDRVLLDKQRIQLGDFAREIVQHLSVLAEMKSQRLKIKVGSPSFAHADPVLLRQAIVNLLDNAIKYSPEKSEIVVRVTSSGQKTYLEVSDSGPGIASEHLGKIFDRFYRGDTSRSRDLGGAGLGLSIARWAVEANGGQIEVTSELGHGSQFVIWLPTDAR